MFFSIAVALASALLYGVSDFFGSVAAARIRVVPATLIIYLLATTVIGIAALFTGPIFSGGTLFWGALAGLSAIVGFLTFYAAMAAGPMSLVSPLEAVLSAMVPVGFAIVRGENLAVWTWVAVGFAVLSGVLVSVRRRERGFGVSGRTIALATVSGVTLGLSVVALDYAPPDAGLAPAFTEVAVGLVLLGILILLATRLSRLRRLVGAFDEHDDAGASGVPITATMVARARWQAIAGGALLGGANALLLIGLQTGSLAVVSVLVGLYPLATIALARLVLKERITPPQGVGVALAVVATSIFAFSQL